MTTTEKLAKIAANEQIVYEKGVADGKQNDYDTFWDALQSNGTRKSYSYFFAGWQYEVKDFFRPKYSMAPTMAFQMFYQNKALVDFPALCESCDITLDFSNCENMSNVFYGCTNLTHLGVIDTTGAPNLAGLCGACPALTTIDTLVLKADGTQVFSGTFAGCGALQNITVTGAIGGSGLSFKDSTGLTAVSLVSILTALTKDSILATGKSITFATASQAVINASAAAKAQYDAAVAAGWTIAFA